MTLSIVCLILFTGSLLYATFGTDHRFSAICGWITAIVSQLHIMELKGFL